MSRLFLLDIFFIMGSEHSSLDQRHKAEKWYRKHESLKQLTITDLIPKNKSRLSWNYVNKTQSILLRDFLS